MPVSAARLTSDNNRLEGLESVRKNENLERKNYVIKSNLHRIFPQSSTSTEAIDLFQYWTLKVLFLIFSKRRYLDNNMNDDCRFLFNFNTII